MLRADRLVAGGGVLLTTVAVSLAIVLAPTEETPDRVDLAVLADLVGRLTRGETAEYTAEYLVDRSGPGPSFVAEVVVAQNEEIRAEVGGGNLTVTTADRRVSCTVSGDEPQCLERPIEDGPPTAVVVAEMVRSGLYTVAPAGASRAADEAARCFDVELVGDEPVGLLGFSTFTCLTVDGIPTRTEVDRRTAVDERVALSVRRDVTDEDIAEILDPFDPELAAG